MKSAFFTDSRIAEEGSGGSAVSFHELKALTEYSGKYLLPENPRVYEKLPDLIIEKAYPRNPFMYDYYLASILDKPDDVRLAHFYGASFTLCMKRLTKAVKTATVAAHNLEVSLEEWADFKMWKGPPPHLTNDSLFRLVCKGLVEEVDKIICPSRRSADYLRGKLGIDASRFAVIPHGVDLPQNCNSEKPGFIVFNLGAFGPDKGVKYLANAWNMLRFEIDGELIIAGTEFNKYLFKPYLDVTSAFEERFKFHPLDYIAKEVKEIWYNAASVYVLPSVTEGFGLTVLEAMSHGVPVVVAEGAGASELVENGINGFVVPIRDSLALADAIKHFYDNPSEVKRMGANARMTAEKYSWEKIEEEYKKVWQSLT